MLKEVKDDDRDSSARYHSSNHGYVKRQITARAKAIAQGLRTPPSLLFQTAELEPRTTAGSYKCL